MNSFKDQIENLKESLFSEKAKKDLDTFSRCWGRVLWHFNHDKEKTNSWFKTENPGLGNLSPMYLFRSGRVEYLEKFIKSCMNED